MVHRFEMLGERVALDVESDAVHVLDGLAYELVGSWSEERGGFSEAGVERAMRAHGKPQTLEAMQEIEELVSSGQLFTPASGYAPHAEPPPAATPQAEAAPAAAPHAEAPSAAIASEGGCAAPAAAPRGEQAPSFKSLCLHVAHDCNMRCAYCFASSGSFGATRSLMSAETAKQAIDFVAASSGPRRNVEIDFFGGEPLLNFGVVKQTVEYARGVERAAGKSFRFTLTTNGLLLEGEAARFANENMDNLVLSADGRQHVHDAMRKDLSGGGTYADVIARLKGAVASRGEKSYYVRGTYTARNKDFAADVMHLASLGFEHVSVEPAVAPSDPELEFAPDDLPELLGEYVRLAERIHELRAEGASQLDFFHFRLDLDGGPCRARRRKGCGAGFEYAAVAPDGGIYPCHQLAGRQEFRLGDVRQGITAPGVGGSFREAGSIEKAPCASCWAKYFCGGGCAANAWHYSRDIAKPNAFYCELQKKRLECAIWLKCAQKQQSH